MKETEEDERDSSKGGWPLFETYSAKGRLAFKFYALSVFIGIVLIWVYRAMYIFDGGDDSSRGITRWVWIGLFAADIWFGFYWILTLSVRWNPIYRRTFKDRLSSRYEDKLPAIDVYVCTANPKIEPPAMVVNTVLSVMAYDYPIEKLSVYLSDDGGSCLTFYALWEASRFAKIWLPFCREFKITPTSPAAYFDLQSSEAQNGTDTERWSNVRKSYKEMEQRINTVVRLDKIPEEIVMQNKAFSEWSADATPLDHKPIVQVLIDGRRPADASLPTLVYVAREKRPQHFHNYKAGAMNTLIRVSSTISNGDIILNVDCDMYSNNPESFKDALCFFMDEEQGRQIGFVQFPQDFNNITRNDVYGNGLKLFKGVDFFGLDGLGGPMYTGTGCFHRRHSLLGNKYSASNVHELRTESNQQNMEDSISTLEERSKLLSTCSFEQNTQWGKEVGLKYGCPVEDVITGLSIQCNGWKSVYYNPPRKAFLGVAPITLGQTLIQQKRWSEGDLQIMLSKYCPFIYGQGSIKLGLMMAYAIYCLWAPNSLPVLFYVVTPPLCLLCGIPLFPSILPIQLTKTSIGIFEINKQVSNIWFLPFGYVVISTTLYNIGESIHSGHTLRGWWNEKRMWLYKRTTSHFFALIDTLLKLLGFGKSTFIITAKVAEDDVSERYEHEMMEFGESFSQMFTILSSLSVLNLACLMGGLIKVFVGGKGDVGSWFLQLFLCVVLVIINIPVYEGMFIRKDSGRMPTSVTTNGIVLGLGGSLLAFAVGTARG